MLVELNIPAVPIGVWEAIVADAEAKGVSRTEVAAAALADRFRVKRDPGGAPFRRGPLDPNRPLMLRVPETLRMKIRLAAAREGGTIRGVVIETLAMHYGLPTMDTGRRART